MESFLPAFTYQNSGNAISFLSLWRSPTAQHILSMCKPNALNQYSVGENYLLWNLAGEVHNQRTVFALSHVVLERASFAVELSSSGVMVLLGEKYYGRPGGGRHRRICGTPRLLSAMTVTAGSKLSL